jgi:hypothetical protein
LVTAWRCRCSRVAGVQPAGTSPEKYEVEAQ